MKELLDFMLEFTKNNNKPWFDNHKAKYRLFLLVVLLLSITKGYCQAPSTKEFHDGVHHWNLNHKDRNYPRYTDKDYVGIADNLLTYQNQDGGWMKNMDWMGILNVDSVKNTLNQRNRQSTLDNSNTFSQIEYLAGVYHLTGDKKYADGCKRGLEYLLNTQKDNGGWRGWDVDAITFNDNVSSGALLLFQRITFGDSIYNWLDKDTKERIKKGYERGLDMVLKCQYVQNGVKTAWAQQHDNVTLQPVGARTFELAGLTPGESCPILELLMNIPNPSPDIIEAVDCGVAWIEKVAIHGIRVEKVPIPVEQQTNHEYPWDKVVVKDPDAEPIWARYYDLKDNTPFFCNRDGIKVYSLAEVKIERRVGYAWYQTSPAKTLRRYKKWRKKLTVKF